MARGQATATVRIAKNEDESFRYICWEGEITSFEDALTIASVWADCTTRYI